MSILSTEQLGHSFNDNWLFQNITFGISRGQRIALVGANGAGKSTLLRIISGLLKPEEGKVVTERDLRIGFLDQDPQFAQFDRIADFIYSQDNEQQQLIRQYEEAISAKEPDEQLIYRLTDQLTQVNAWEYEYQIKTILERLAVYNPEQKISTLSGGQRKRLALAKLLIEDPDIFILDEPTNHLDIEMIEWLESFITTGNKTVLLVTHDRYFLDQVCNVIIELANGKLFTYKGNYAYYLEKKAERETEEVAQFQKNSNLLKKELEWMRRQPQARGTKSKARIDAFYELEAKTKLSRNSTVDLSVTVSRQGNKILEISHVSKSFGNKKIITDFSYTVKKGDRIGIAGKNGSGKSTLLNLITGKIKPDEGTVSIGETTVFGYYSQAGLEFNEQERVLDVVKNIAEFIPMADGKTLTASQLLTRFLFPPKKQHAVVSKLSGGEKKRLHLMKVLMKNPNFLILDEPTNDLDIDTLNVLEDFLENYTGVLFLVSHDRYLMDKLTDQLFIVESGHINVFNGNYSEYKFKQKTKEPVKEVRTSLSKQTSEKKVKLSYKQEKELENLEQEIEQLEKKVKDLTEQLNRSTNHVELTEIGKQIEDYKNLLDEKSMQWLELSESV
ncbi:ABC-F family ATP-binding cassette domain-containing protein (plasmid) [Pedobacter sp. BS3]|uniref:ABC-F family ATP-binding cassette domain-containing protein n=1 Tax=Pedobacter sp. BS3 TaxID=2567937 RepID=UPI0011EEC97F|nr:ABC-F family ATP-binding cassette domain-containing protein [Pedobacter sp. BS3]TZF85780.1 ABC-F family ATP-binding cassette domain-containing protein [Pedobacter sp. BS3]